MHINLENIVKFINISEKTNKNTSLNGKIVDVKGNIVKIASNDKLYIIAVKNTEVLKGKTVVELLFSNREVTTPQSSFQKYLSKEKYIEAKLLFVADIKDLMPKSAVEIQPAEQKDIILNILQFLFSNDSTTEVLASLEPGEIDILFEDLKELFEKFSKIKPDNIKTSEFEVLKKNMMEFLLRLGKNLKIFLTFPKNIRLDILKLYLNLEKRDIKHEPENLRKIFFSENTDPKKEHENLKIIKHFEANPVESKNIPEDTNIIKREFSAENILKTHEYSNNITKGTGNDIKSIKSENNSQLSTYEKPEEQSKQQPKIPGMIENSNIQYKQSQNKITDRHKSYASLEIKKLVNLLKFSLATFNLKTLKKTRNSIPAKTEINSSHLGNSLEISTKELKNSSFENLGKKIYGFDFSKFSEKIFSTIVDSESSEKEHPDFKNTTGNKLPNQLNEKIEHRALEKLENSELSVEKVFEEFKHALLEHMNEKDVDKILSLFRKMFKMVDMVVEKVAIFVDNKRRQSVLLKDSLIVLKDEIEKRLIGKKDSIEKAKNIIDDFTEKILEKQSEKENEEPLLKIDEKKILYSKIINYISEFPGIHSFFLDFGKVSGRIDFIDEKLDPKIKKGFRLIFDLNFQNLGKVLLDIIINSRKVDMRLFVEEKVKELFNKNFEKFKILFNEEGYSLRSFLVLDAKESKILRDERLLLFSGSEGNYNWIA